MRLKERLARAYLTADLRSLALGRIGLAVVLLADLVSRALVLRDFYSNEGLLPNHMLLWRPEHHRVFSLFFMASTPFEAGVGFALCGVAYMCLLAGFRTRLAQVTSFLAVLSLHARVFINGGDVVLADLAMWSMFLPLGRRYSIDAALAARRAVVGTAVSAPTAGPHHAESNAERTAAAATLNASDPSGARDRIQALGVAALIGQLASIYLFNAINKNGQTWRAGSAVHYVLHQDTIVTQLGLWVRGWITPALSKALTWTALIVEWALPFLWLSPVALRPARRAAILLSAGLHLAFVLFLNLQMFTPAMLAYLPFLLPGADAAAFERACRRAWGAARARGGVRALETAARATISAIARHEDRARARRASATDPPFGAALRRQLARGGDLLLMLLLAVAAIGLWADNTRGWNGPPWLDQAASYLQLYQRWSMFAPDAPRTDTNVVVDAMTVDGRHVDPFSELANPHHPFPGTSIPARLDQSPLYVEYALRIPWIREYHGAFRDWILRYPERTGRAADKIVSFRAFLVEDDSPPPGLRLPTNSRATLFYEYAEP